MEPLLENKRDSSLNTKGSGTWAGTLVGALVGVLAGAVGLAIEFLELNSGPPSDNWDYSVPTSWGPLGAFGGVVAGAIAGTIGLWIGQRVTAKVGGAFSGLVGGAIGAGIGAIAPVCWLIAVNYYHADRAMTTILVFCLLAAVPGAIIGVISGLAIAIFGMRNLSIIPMIAFLGFCAGVDLGFTVRSSSTVIGFFWLGAFCSDMVDLCAYNARGSCHGRTVIPRSSPGCIRRGDWWSRRDIYCNDDCFLYRIFNDLITSIHDGIAV
jgi:hypothetical protein